LAGRSNRKRGRRTKPPGPTATATRARPAVEPAPAPKPRSRSEERNEAVRATLAPLAPGERPWSLKVATLVAILIGGGDLVVVLVDGSFKVGGTHASAGGVLLFSVLMLVCAGGMWQQRYWAVLGFQAILVFVILFFSLFLIRASNVLGLVSATIIVCGAGFLFYKLVRILSRLQMPTPPGR
jgi:hypothetical protein